MQDFASRLANEIRVDEVRLHPLLDSDTEGGSGSYT